MMADTIVNKEATKMANENLVESGEITQAEADRFKKRTLEEIRETEVFSNAKGQIT